MTRQAETLPLYTIMLAALPDPRRLQDLVARSRARRGLAFAPESHAAVAELAAIGEPIRAAMLDWLMAQWVSDSIVLLPAAPAGEPHRMSLRAMVEGAVPIGQEHHATATSWTADWADGEPVRLPVLTAAELHRGLAARSDLSEIVLRIMAGSGLLIPDEVRDTLAVADTVLASRGLPA